MGYQGPTKGGHRFLFCCGRIVLTIFPARSPRSLNMWEILPVALWGFRVGASRLKGSGQVGLEDPGLGAAF